MCLAWKEIIAEIKDVAVLGTDVWQSWVSKSNVGTAACYVKSCFGNSILAHNSIVFPAVSQLKKK